MALSKTELYLSVLTDSAKNQLTKAEFGYNSTFTQLNNH